MILAHKRLSAHYPKRAHDTVAPPLQAKQLGQDESIGDPPPPIYHRKVWSHPLPSEGRLRQTRSGYVGLMGLGAFLKKKTGFVTGHGIDKRTLQYT